MKTLLISLFFSINAFAADRIIPEDMQINFELLSTFTSEKDHGYVNMLIKTQIDPRLGTPQSAFVGSQEMVASHSEGTGTRGGGSGILKKKLDGKNEVKLLDIYRSEHRESFPLFFEIDKHLLKVNASKKNRDDIADEIFHIVVARTLKVMPALAKRIIEMAKTIPFSSWTPSLTIFPLIDDFVGENHLNPDEEQVQVAYRKNLQIIYDEDLYGAMDGLNRAALYLHEYLYIISSTKESVAIQRLVSLLMSTKILENDFAKNASQMMFEFKLNAIASPTIELPPGVVLTNEPAGKNSSCGYLVQIRANPGDKTIVMRLAMESPTEKGKAQLIERRLTPKETLYFMNAAYSLKNQLSVKFPIFLYPAQNTMADVVCINKDEGTIETLEVGTKYHKAKNENELMGALLEATYFKTQRDYVLNPNEKTREKFYRIEELILRNSLEHLKFLDPKSLDEESQVLGTLKVKF
jgi:hypothetical protein